MIHFSALFNGLQRNLHGQHIASKIVSEELTHHMTKHPCKALTLSLYGGTGTGKNYLSKIIAESIYKNGMRSKFVHLISVAKEFPHRGMVPLYRVILILSCVDYFN